MILCLLFSLQAALAQASFKSEGPSKEVPEGSRFEVSFSLKNTAANRFIPPDFNGFRVTGGPSEMRGSGFVNGKSYNHQTWTYELEAGPPGTYTIGTATVQTASRTLRSDPLIIRVSKAKPSSAGPPAGADEGVFINANLEKETAWIGQQVIYQIKLYTQVGISDYDILDLPQFNGFFTQERRRFDTRTQYETIKGKRYATRVLHEISLFPQQEGDLRIGPARVRLGLDQPGSLRALLGAKPLLVQTQPVVLQVKSLPKPEPANFSGAVGRYTWQVSADKDALTTDDALTLRVSIEGNGDAQRFANPVFELPEGLEGFEPKIQEQEAYETGEQFVHARTLEYVILPREPGDYSFLPELVIFDPDSNKYHSLKAPAPIQMHVTAGPLYGQESAPIDSISTRQPSGSSLSNAWEAVFSWLKTPFAWGVLVGILGFSLFLFWWRTRQQKPLVEKVEASRPKSSLKTVQAKMKNLNRLMQGDDPRVFYHELLKTMQEHVAFYLGLEPVLLTKELLQEKLAERQVSEATIRALTQVWQKCEQVVFAGQSAVPQMTAVWQQADAALYRLDAELK